MIKNVYFLYNYSINCWGRIDPEAQKCKQETTTIGRLNLIILGFSLADYDVKELGGQSEYLTVTLKEYRIFRTIRRT